MSASIHGGHAKQKGEGGVLEYGVQGMAEGMCVHVRVHLWHVCICLVYGVLHARVACARTCARAHAPVRAWHRLRQPSAMCGGCCHART